MVGESSKGQLRLSSPTSSFISFSFLSAEREDGTWSWRGGLESRERKVGIVYA